MRPFDFEQIFRQAPTAFSIVDLEGRQIDGSDHYWGLFGIDPMTLDRDDAVVARLTDTHDAKITRQYFDKLISGAVDEVVVEKRYRRTDGECFWGRLRSRPVVDAAGNVVAVAGVITDISAEREARDALVASEVERSRADHRVVANAIRSFIGGVEHQIRSPLHSILGLTELLASGNQLEADQRRALHAEALRLHQIVEEISEFSRTELDAIDTAAAARHRNRLDDQRSASLDDAAAAHRRRTADGSSSALPKPQVLVVDDGEVSRLLAVSQLQRLGYIAVTACNGLEALDMAAGGRFDAILMDWHMPVLDGVDAARRIRQSEEAGARVPIIAITASAVAGDRTTCLEAGMDDVLIKPVTINVLDAALRRRLPNPPQRRFGDLHFSTTGTDAVEARSSIDARALEELERKTGDRSVVGVIIDTYLDELDQRLAAIGSAAEAVATGELDVTREVMRSAHTLKSTAALVGAARLSHLCEQLQILAADRLGPDAALLADAVIAEGRRTAVDLQGIRSTL